MRYSGSPSANLLTMRYASRLAEAMLLGIGGSTGSCARTTAPWQWLQEYFSRCVSCTSSLAGM